MTPDVRGPGPLRLKDIVWNIPKLNRIPGCNRCASLNDAERPRGIPVRRGFVRLTRVRAGTSEVAFRATPKRAAALVNRDGRMPCDETG
jgi:hypothetical protein